LLKKEGHWKDILAITASRMKPGKSMVCTRLQRYCRTRQASWLLLCCPSVPFSPSAPLQPTPVRPAAIADDSLDWFAAVAGEFRLRLPRHLWRCLPSDILHGRPVPNREALANPASLAQFANRRELQED